MKDVLARAKELVNELSELLNKEEKKGDTELSELAAGEEFYTEIGEFIVLEQLEGITKVITKDLYLKDVVFDNTSADYRNSDLKKIFDEKIYEKFCEVFGKENIIEHEANLITVDGQQEYGMTECYVRPLTFDEARKYNDLLVNEDLPDWYWTCTAWSVPGREWSRSLAVVSPSGYIINLSYVSCNGVRPFCILKSNIFVSKEEK